MSQKSSPTILFDIDGTLIDAAGAGQEAMAVSMRQLFGSPTSPRDISCSGRTDRAIMQDFFDMHGVEDVTTTFEQSCEAFLKILRDYLPRFPGQVLPGVFELLAQVAEHPAITLGLLTGNLRQAARMKLEHYGLADYFYRAGDPIGGFGDIHLDRNDVARDAVATIVERHGRSIDPSSIWVVGDTPNDVRCARAIGANVVAVATGTFSRAELAATKPDLLFDDLTACGIWLDQL